MWISFICFLGSLAKVNTFRSHAMDFKRQQMIEDTVKSLLLEARGWGHFTFFMAMIWRYFFLFELEGEEGETKLESKTSDTMTWRKHGLIHLYCHFYYFSKVLWAVIWIFYPWMCALNWAILTWTYTHTLTVTFFFWPFRKPSASRMTLDYLILNLIKILGFNSSVEIMLTHTRTHTLKYSIPHSYNCELNSFMKCIDYDGSPQSY